MVSNCHKITLLLGPLGGSCQGNQDHRNSGRSCRHINCASRTHKLFITWSSNQETLISSRVCCLKPWWNTEMTCYPWVSCKIEPLSLIENQTLVNSFLNLNINTTNLPTTFEKFVNISISFHSWGVSSFIRVSKYSKKIKSLGLRPRAFISFLRDETFALVFEIVHHICAYSSSQKRKFTF